MEKLKYSTGKKERFNVNLDRGVVEKSRALLKTYNQSFSGHIENLLDQWCKEKDEANKFHEIVEETIDDLKKAGSEMPEKEAIKMLLQVSEERKKKMLLNDPKSKALMRDLEENSHTQTKEQKENAEKLLKDFKEKLSKKEGGKS